MVQTKRVIEAKNESGRTIGAGELVELVELTPTGGVRPAERPKFTALGDVITDDKPQVPTGPAIDFDNVNTRVPGDGAFIVPTGDWSEEYGQHAHGYGWGMAHQAMADGHERKAAERHFASPGMSGDATAALGEQLHRFYAARNPELAAVDQEVIDGMKKYNEAHIKRMQAEHQRLLAEEKRRKGGEAFGEGIFDPDMGDPGA